MSRIKDDNYFQISGWMLNRLHLKGIALEVFAIIYGFSQDGESKFTGSIKYLCDFTGTSKPTVIKALKELVSSGYLIKTEFEKNGIKFNEYKANLQAVKNLYRGGEETLPVGGKESLPVGGKETLPNNKSSDNEDINNKTIYIIDYLNKKAGTSFRAKSKATQQHINARLSEGYTTDDFKTVIDNKCADWLGSDWAQYLRPSTLFGSKFENYLNAKQNTKKQNNVNTAEPNILDEIM